MTKTKLLSNKGILLITLLFSFPFLGFGITSLYPDNPLVFEYNSNEYNYGVQDFYVNYRLTLLGAVLSVAGLIFVLAVFYYRPKLMDGNERNVSG